MARRLPKHICVLDLETERADFANPEKSKLAFVGVMPYTLKNRRYYPSEHRCFLPHQMKELEDFLRRFPGILVGHNLYDFDFRVLRPLISLRGLIEKAVDTLYILREKNKKRVAGLSLNDVSLINFGTRKLLDGRAIPDLWRRGRFRKVINYNKQDCLLTKTLWFAMVRQRPIGVNYRSFTQWSLFRCRSCRKTHIGELLMEGKLFVKRSHYRPKLNFPRIMLQRRDVPHLTGQSPLFTFAAWTRRIQSNGSVFGKRRKAAERSVRCKDCGDWLAEMRNLPSEKLIKCNFVGELRGKLTFKRWETIQKGLWGARLWLSLWCLVLLPLP